MRKVFCLLLVYLIIHGTAVSQSKPVKSNSKTGALPVKKDAPPVLIDSVTIAPDATKDARIAYYRKVQNIYVNNYLSQPLHKETEKDWITAFDGMLKTGFSSPLAINRLHYAFADIGNRSSLFQESLLELLNASFPLEFSEDIGNLLNKTKSAKTFALCMEYLIKDPKNDKYRTNYKRLLQQKSLSETNNPVYQILEARLNNKITHNPPPIADLLKFEFVKGNMILYSIQRINRDYPGLIIIRKPDGKFLRNADNSIFYIPQVARSITNLPFYFNSGNTPQGIYRIAGIDTIQKEFVGPTAVVKLLMPYEAKVSRFNPRIKDTSMYWNAIFYKNLIPVSWRAYEPIYEAYYAGMTGRRGIMAHGTTVNPEYYAGAPWYPLTLFTGSLSTKELWDEKTGSRIESDQYKLIKGLLTSGKPEGYLIVVDIDEQDKPVEISQIEQIIQGIESAP